MKSDCVIACTGYDDFLAKTLKHNVGKFNKIIVVTKPNDIKTIECCEVHNIRCIQTQAWEYGGATLNKGRALNVGLDEVSSDWVCVIDADIIVPKAIRTGNLDPRVLYSAKRRMCESFVDYADCELTGITSASIKKFPIDRVPVRRLEDGKLAVWGNPHCKTSNVAGILGYFQMWNRKRYRVKFPTNFGFAHSYDVRFALHWPEDLRKWLRMNVLHLGQTHLNWKGRITSRWDQ